MKMTKKELLLKKDIEIESPSYLITVVQLPTGALELIINRDNIQEKISYISRAYNDNLELNANNDVKIIDFILV